MGREIISISVPIGSAVWHTIKKWQETEGVNVSLKVCDALSDKGLLVDRIDTLTRKIRRIAKATAKQPHTIDKETWELELEGWVYCLMIGII